jgi:hypothetical protein
LIQIILDKRLMVFDELWMEVAVNNPGWFLAAANCRSFDTATARAPLLIVPGLPSLRDPRTRPGRVEEKSVKPFTFPGGRRSLAIFSSWQFSTDLARLLSCEPLP